MNRIKDSAWLCNLALRTEEDIKKILPQRNYEFNGFVDVKHVQCFVAERDKKQVVVFRETESPFINGKINKEGIMDWINNLKYFPVEYKRRILHGEFSRILDEAQDEILSYIKDKNFVSTGASQGGSLARMFAFKVSKVVDKKDIFNQYKPFFVSFEPAQESKTDDYYTNGIYTQKGNDIVVMIPLSLTGWNQSGELIYLTGKTGRVIINPEKAKKALLIASDTIMDLSDGLNADDLLRDHLTFNILKAWEQPKNQEKILNFVREKFKL